MGNSRRLGASRYEADEHYRTALDYYHKGNLEPALQAIEAALALIPKNSEYHACKGLFHLVKGEPTPAKLAFETALNIHESEMLANYGLGVLAFNDKQWDDARKYFTTARAVYPNHAEIPYYLALIHHREQDNQTALLYMQHATQLMEGQHDKRVADARRWLREFEKLIQQAQNRPDALPVQPSLFANEQASPSDEAPQERVLFIPNEQPALLSASTPTDSAGVLSDDADDEDATDPSDE
ncbi:MAG: tetratricopeptide repeat protein [Phototrophicaceae bacterium]